MYEEPERRRPAKRAIQSATSLKLARARALPKQRDPSRDAKGGGRIQINATCKARDRSRAALHKCMFSVTYDSTPSTHHAIANIRASAAAVALAITGPPARRKGAAPDSVEAQSLLHAGPSEKLSPRSHALDPRNRLNRGWNEASKIPRLGVKLTLDDTISVLGLRPRCRLP